MWKENRVKLFKDKLEKIESMYQSSKRHFPDVPEVTPKELQRLRSEQKVVVVDVRSPEEQAVSMISGAVTAQHFEKNWKEYEGATVVAYCTTGHRSGLFARDLQAMGWNAFNLKGAILGWTHGGGELVNAEGPTRKVHVYNRQCNLVAEGYEGVW